MHEAFAMLQILKVTLLRRMHPPWMVTMLKYQESQSCHYNPEDIVQRKRCRSSLCTHNAYDEGQKQQKELHGLHNVSSNSGAQLHGVSKVGGQP